MAVEVAHREADARRFDLWVMRACLRAQVGQPKVPEKPDYSMCWIRTSEKGSSTHSDE